MDKCNELTSQDYWDSLHTAQPRLRLPSTLVVATRNLQRILKRYIEPGMRVLEIGFAPGKQLAYVSRVLGADVTGVDYSENGVKFAQRLFESLGIEADLRCEDIFQTALPRNRFDFVYSVGVIEHFADPTEIVRCHAKVLKPGGTGLILIPNYMGLYGKLQQYFDPENLRIHNLEIMTTDALARLAPQDLIASARPFRAGRVDPSQISFHRRWSPLAAKSIRLSAAVLGHLQPLDINVLCPWLVLEMKRNDRDA